MLCRTMRTGRFALATFVAVALGCGGGATPAPPPPAVTVARPTAQSVTTYLEFTGNTAASDSVTLVARVEGFLSKISFTDGARVKQGALLFTIQPDQYVAQLQQAEAQVAAQKASLVHARTELARYTELVKEDSAPQTQVDRWQYERDAAIAGVQGAEAQVALAKLNLGYTRITAPFDGRMGRHLVDPGNLVGALGQQTSLAQIDKLDPLYVYFTVDERDVLRILEHRRSSPHEPIDQGKIPASFGLLDEEGYPHDGHVDFASLSVAPTTGTLQARAIFGNPEPGVLPGLFARVRVPAGEIPNALEIPGEALSFDQQGEYVLVVNADDVVERRRVTTGPHVGERVVVKDGLTADDRVVVAGLQRAIPGRKVAPSEAESGSVAPSAGKTTAPGARPSASTGATPAEAQAER
jgi:membrane fusion protein, multidrug efflux system